jgi:hypothetical protein
MAWDMLGAFGGPGNAADLAAYGTKPIPPWRFAAVSDRALAVCRRFGSRPGGLPPFRMQGYL